MSDTSTTYVVRHADGAPIWGPFDTYEAAKAFQSTKPRDTTHVVPLSAVPACVHCGADATAILWGDHLCTPCRQRIQREAREETLNELRSEIREAVNRAADLKCLSIDTLDVVATESVRSAVDGVKSWRARR